MIDVLINLESFHNAYVFQIIMLCPLNILQFCQLHVEKAGKKKKLATQSWRWILTSRLTTDLWLQKENKKNKIKIVT